jgi:hypothetical protein
MADGGVWVRAYPPKEPQEPAISVGVATEFLTDGTYEVPAGISFMRLALVGGGASASGRTGGRGGEVVDTVVPVIPGETLTVVVGPVNGDSTVSGSFGTVTATGGSQNKGAGQSGNGTYLPLFGWKGGGGGNGNPGDPFNNCSPGGYGGGGGVQKLDSSVFHGKAGGPNSGGGGGGGNHPATGGTGWVGMVTASEGMDE